MKRNKKKNTLKMTPKRKRTALLARPAAKIYIPDWQAGEEARLPTWHEVMEG